MSSSSRTASKFLAIIALLSLSSLVWSEEAKPLKWNDLITLSGDFRYRHELINLEGDPMPRNRERIRARLGLAAQVNEDWKVNFRLTTGETENSTSANQTLADSVNKGDGESRKIFWLETANVEWKPAENVNFYIGKFPMPLFLTDLVFSPDLSFEGGFAKSEFKMNEKMTMFASFGESWLRENSKSNDQSLMIATLGIKGNCCEYGYWLGCAYFDFSNVKDYPLFYGKSLGNTLDSNRSFGRTFAAYKYDYDLMDVATKLEWNGLKGYPVNVFGEYVQNGDVGEKNTAWVGGFQFGKAKNPKNWGMLYSYRKIESDAIVGALAEPSIGVLGSNYNCNRIEFEYCLAKNVNTTVRAYDVKLDPTGANKKFRQYQLDLVLKF